MTNEIIESAKAVQEMAKATGQTTKVIERVGRFFSTVMGESIDTTCGMLADTLKFKRWKRQISLIEKTERIINDKNLEKDFHPIPPKLVLPIFHNASIEDDEYLHNIYAKLLASVLDPKKKVRRVAFVEILRQLESIDVKIIQAIYEIATRKSKKYHSKYQGESWYSNALPLHHARVTRVEILRIVNCSEGIYMVAIDNLFRLRLADAYIEEDVIDIDSESGYETHDVVTAHGGYDSLNLTALGIQFVEICNY